jgi:hypothetical protein
MEVNADIAGSSVWMSSPRNTPPWTSFLRNLLARELPGIELASDTHKRLNGQSSQSWRRRLATLPSHVSNQLSAAPALRRHTGRSMATLYFGRLATRRNSSSSTVTPNTRAMATAASAGGMLRPRS